ncbi:MAG: SusC/RagA family TonB-linked outer membrane protein [Gemmatimonadetes bacterium]|nr:SusC/RagA family TonB-linked outer membrane protein [Gemmatimonadota bacterium]
MSSLVRVALAAVLLVPALSARAFSQGTITGSILDARSRRPLAGAQVFIANSAVGALSASSGRYLLVNAPAGEVSVQVELLGYRKAARTVTVPSGGSVAVNFELDEEALELDEIIVTGTAGGTQRRAIGNVVDRVDAAKLAEITPSLNMEQTLGQRTPGVTVYPASGMIGTGSVMRIRGVSSMSLPNQPIIIVDGVRVDNEPATGPPLRQGRQVSRLNDLNLEEVESIEVIKGPAAATLYGTEAANGVVQIITKRGRQGPPTVEVAIAQGANWMDDPEGRILWTYSYDDATGKRDSMNVYQLEKARGNNVFQTGHLQSYTVSLRGGSDLVRYFSSVDVDDNEGILSYNWQKKLGARTNLTLVPNEQWEINGNLGYIESKTRFGQAAAGFGIWDMIIYSSPTLLNTPNRGFRYANPETAAKIESLSNLDRFTASAEIRFRPFEWFQQRLVAGRDVVEEENSQLFPRVPPNEINFFGSRGVGSKLVETRDVKYSTLDYSATASFELRPEVRSATSFGAQYVHKGFTTLMTQGDNFPAPSVTTVAGASQTRGSEDFIENKTLGFYLQQQFDWHNRLFVTGALRGDGNSAFGSEFKAAYYPKFSATWVISEEAFWNLRPVNTLRLRTAWGQAGLQPDVFAAVTLYTPTVGSGAAPALTPNTLGNPNLKPEVGDELEFGFDAGLLEDRLTAAFTYYTRTTRDAIVAKPVRPSEGFPGSQMVNLGKVKNWGVELALTGRVLEGERLGWDLGLNLATHKNRIESLGGLPPIVFGDQQHREGYPIASIFHWKVVHAEYDAKGALVNVLCDGGAENDHKPMPCGQAPKLYWGQPNPRWSGNVNSTVTLLRNLQLYALVDFRGGFTQISGDIQGPATVFRNTTTSTPMRDPIYQAYRDVVPRAPIGMYDAGFAKLRELSATFTLPESWVRGFKRASLTAAWRNVALLWAAQKDTWGEPIFDPEIRTPGGEHDARFQTVMPPTMHFLTTLRLTF